MRPAGFFIIPEQYVFNGGTGAFVRFHKGDFVGWSASVNVGS
jgi:hypothetical protein